MRVCSYCHLLLGDSESACPHDGTPSEAIEVPAVPPALHNKFSEFEPFARGRTGTTYLAKQSLSGYRGLLKVIPLARIDASERVRLKRELRKQTQLRHEGLPRILDGGDAGNDLWLFREHVQGESLAHRIRRLSGLDVPSALLITAQVASALDELQRNGLLHRDVKPGHVLLSDGPSGLPLAKLIDAGLPGRLPTGSVFDLLGTPAYISPEQVAGKLVSFRSDLYALGCVLFEMLSGLPPFPDSDVPSVLEAHKSTPAPSLELELPAQVQTLLRAMLAKEPRQRPFSAQQVRRTLEPLLPAGAALPALGTRPLASAVARNTAGAMPAVTEEIELEELDINDHSGPAPKTLSLGPEDIEEIDPSNMGPKTLSLSADDVDALEVREEIAAALADVGSAREPAAGVQEAIEREPEPVAAPLIAAPAAAQPAPAEAPARRAVEFDVESLFDDDVPAGSAREHESLHDAAPTQLYRMPESTPPSAEQKPANTPATRATVREREGTVVAKRPKAKKPIPLTWIAVGIGALVVLIAFALRGGSRSAANETTATAPSATAEQNTASAAAPIVHPVEKTAADQPGHAAEPAHAAEPPEHATAEPAHAAEPPEHATAEHGSDQPANDTANAKANAPADQGGTAAQPTVGAANATQAGAVNPVPGTVVPATIASAKTNDTDLGRSAELTAANQAGRSQPPSASAKLMAAQGTRADRVAKADELKAQARTAYQEGRYREAATAYEKATEQNPSDAGAFAGLGAMKLALNDGNAAIAAYSRAIRLQPASSGFHAALGRAYLQENDRARARAAYEHALQLDPNNAAAKTALAQLK
jgi:serine/threonine protein kinase/tetratricopeptide (TPR) repeat protein